jgi:hypothetical protein
MGFPQVYKFWGFLFGAMEAGQRSACMYGTFAEVLESNLPKRE